MTTYLFTFHTHFDALSFMKFAKDFGAAKMKPVPRQLSSSCGTCVVFTPTHPDALQEANCKSFDKMYRLTETDYELVCENE